jgi:hypothetical protein
VDVVHFEGSLVSVIRAFQDRLKLLVAPNNGRISIVGLDMAGVRARNATGLEVDTSALDFDDHDTFTTSHTSVHIDSFLMLAN